VVQNDEAWPCCDVMCGMYVCSLHGKTLRVQTVLIHFLSQTSTHEHTYRSTHKHERWCKEREKERGTECKDTIERCVQENIQPAGIAKFPKSKNTQQEWQADSPSTTSATSWWPTWHSTSEDRQRPNRLGSGSWTATCATQSSPSGSRRSGFLAQQTIKIKERKRE
jgi:hypothetical protein